MEKKNQRNLEDKCLSTYGELKMLNEQRVLIACFYFIFFP
jgi:hypothetical protein